MSDKKFEVRELEFSDVFTACKIVKKVDIKPIIKQFIRTSFMWVRAP